MGQLLPSCVVVPRMWGETRHWLHIASKMCYQEDLVGPSGGLLSHYRICFKQIVPFYFHKAKEQICSLTQLFHYIPRRVCLQPVQLREIRCGGEGKRKPLRPLCALKSISLYF